MNTIYTVYIFFPIRFPNKRDTLNLLNKNRINFCLKIKAGFVTFSPMLRMDPGLLSCLASALVPELHTCLNAEFLSSLTSCHEQWMSPGPALSPFIEWRLLLGNAFSKLISSRHWQKKLIKNCSGTFIWNARQWRPHRKKIPMNLKWPPVAVEVSPVPLSYYGVIRCLGHRAGTVIEVLVLSTRCLL